MTKILLIGSGAREHVIADTLKKSSQHVTLIGLGTSMNPGLKNLCLRYEVGNILDANLVVQLAEEEKVDFAIVGPEAPIEAGVVDALAKIGVPSMAPLKTVGRLESSKSFTRDLLEKHNIKGNPKFKVFYTEEGLHQFLLELDGNYVVKADGLKGGKGVMVSGDHLHSIEEGMKFAQECLEEVGRVVVEEKLIGQEFSLMSFCDGTHSVFMPVIQDHKRAYVGDTGPNTGGMGTYSCADHSMPFLQPSDLEAAKKVTLEVAEALKKETGVEFKGIMYGGFMAVKDGVRLIEYNARFGDPEAMNALTLLQSDFVTICEKVISGTLSEADVVFAKKATVCKYVVPEGYPEAPVKDVKVEVGEVPVGAQVFYGSIDEREDGLYLAGSRALAYIAQADTLAEAQQLVEQGIANVKGPVFHREDIGTSPLIEARIEMMKEIRG